jgi:hypothetical protein
MCADSAKSVVRSVDHVPTSVAIDANWAVSAAVSAAGAATSHYAAYWAVHSANWAVSAAGKVSPNWVAFATEREKQKQILIELLN